MRIVYITNSHIPSVYANGVQTMKMCEAIANLGHELTLFIPANEKEEIQFREDDTFRFYGIERVFEIKITPFRRKSVHAFISSIYAKLKKVDLCYTRCVYAAYFTSRLGVSTIFEVHKPLSSKLGTLIAPSLLFNSPYLKLVSISNSLTKFYIKNYKIKSPQKILTKHDGVDLERFITLPPKGELRRELNLSKDKRIICYAGSLYKGRGIELLLSVSKKLPQGLLVLIVGGRIGDLKRYKSIALEMRCTNVHFTGFILNNAVPKYLAASDVLVMPYQRNAKDPSGQVIADFFSPLKMFEYMASGTPIVASDLSVIREILKDRENAILFDPSDERAFLDSIKIVLEDRELAHKIARNAQDGVKKYTWAKRAKEIFSFL
jgi:glycosyltransferase involved in cell wall biosynthesis